MSRLLLAVVSLVVWSLGFDGGLDAERVRALIDAGKYQEAEAACQQALAAIEREQGPDALGVAEALDLIIEARWQARRVSPTAQESRTFAERALKIKEAQLPADDPRIAMTLVYVGVVRTSARDAANARVAFERAVAIYERSRPESLDLARALATLAWAHWQAHQLPLAKEVGQRALTMTRQTEQPAGRETSAILSTLGGVARSERDSETALDLYQQALAIDEHRSGRDHPQNAYTLIGVSGAADDLGELQLARDAHERALAIIEKIPGAERRLAFELLAYASQLEHYGDFATALTYAERGLAIAERSGPAGSPLQTAALDEMASLQDRLGDHAAAATLRARTLASWSGIQADSVHLATALNGLASSYEEAGQLDDAFTTIERGLALKALQDAPGEHARLLLTYGGLLAKRGRLDEARKALERALVLERSATNDGEMSDTGMIRMELARVERQDRRIARSLALYRESIERSTRVLGPDNIQIAADRIELAGVLAQEGKVDDARALLVQGEDASLAHLRLIARALPDRRALAFAADRASGVDLAVTLASTSVPARRTNVDTAWQMVIRGRTVVLDEMAARQRAVIAESNQPAVREQWTALNRARARLATLIINGPEGSAEEYHTQVEQMRATCDRAERALAQTSVTFRQEQERTHAGAHEVLAQLPKNATLVSYVRYTPRHLDRVGSAPASAPATTASAYAAFIARAGRPVRVVALGSAEAIDRAIAAWREGIQAELHAAGLASARSEAAYRDAGRRLRLKLWDPVVAAAATGTGKATIGGPVFIVPDAAIHLVDFATLPTGSRGYLVDAPISLHYLLAERDLVEPRAEPHGHSLLALGAPDFDRVDRAAASIGAVQQTLAQSISQAPPTNRVNTRSACESFATRTFAPLPATRDEMQQIAQLWRQGGAVEGDRADQQVVMLGDDHASEAAFKALAPGRRVLHLATHGFFLDRTCRIEPAGARGLARTTRLLDESPLLRSGLVLAGANQRASANSDDEDGILTAEEIAGLDLSETQWAVLSACDTGRGDWQPSEGVLGLRRAFDVAGARTVILSLWPVIDTVASQWMTELYRAKFVRNAETAIAVRTASRTLLAARRTAGQSTHPLYWSGFIATGDWR